MNSNESKNHSFNSLNVPESVILFLEVKKDPIQVLMDFLTERGIRPVDLFRQLKQDDQKMVTKEAFLVGLQVNYLYLIVSNSEKKKTVISYN